MAKLKIIMYNIIYKMLPKRIQERLIISVKCPWCLTTCRTLAPGWGISHKYCTSCSEEMFTKAVYVTSKSKAEVSKTAMEICETSLADMVGRGG